jgi:hypothetical protein
MVVAVLVSDLAGEVVIERVSVRRHLPAISASAPARPGEGG